MDSGVVAFTEAMVLAVFLVGSAFTWYTIRLRHKRQEHPELDHELREQLEIEAERRAALEARVAELEERVDFTERRLVQQPFKRIERPETTPV
jgi:Tfp pilus assembly protein PilO